MTVRLAVDARESALVARWLAGLRGPLRLQDGRPLSVIFPGIPGPGHGPDVRDALLDVDGDYLRGDVEFHLLASGWRTHGHAGDPGYAGVVLHAVAHDDCGLPATAHGAARGVPLLVLPPPSAAPSESPVFTPPCVIEIRRGRDVTTPLRSLSLRRLRLRAVRLRPGVASAGPAQALYGALLHTLGGPANAPAFDELARRLPLAALLETAASASPQAPRPLAITAALKGVAMDLPLRRAGLRPAAAPGHRLDAAGALFDRLWPSELASWPPLLSPGALLPGVLQVTGAGRALAVELSVNAVLPVALASSAWPEEAVAGAWFRLPAPGSYGVLRRLESWLGAGGGHPLGSAASVQAALLLHEDYCSRGRCGRCPLSD